MRSTRRACIAACAAIVQWCVNHRITVVVATVGIFIASIVGFGHVQQQFFPLSERPELFLQLRLPEGTAFNVTEKAVKKAETLLKDDKDIATYTAYVGQRLAALLARPQSAASERGLRRDRHRRQGRRGARAHQGQDRERGRRRHADGGARARRPLQFRSAGRLPRPVPRDRPRRQQGARDRLSGPRRHARRTRTSRTSSSTGTSSRPISSSSSTRTAPAPWA